MSRFAHLGVLALCGAVAPAAAAADSIVTVSGSAEARRVPNRLHARLVVMARGKDFADAVGQLRTRAAAVTKKLVELGATEASCEAGEAAVCEYTPPYVQRLQMIAPGARAGRGAKGAGGGEPPVTVGAVFAADWPLDPDPRKGRGAAVAVREKLVTRYRELSGLVEIDKPSEADQAVLDRLEGNDQGFGPGGGMFNRQEFGRVGDPASGSVQVFTVYKRETADRAKLIAEAYREAKKEAEDVAAAVGVKLGALRTVRPSDFTGRDPFEYGSRADGGFGGYAGGMGMGAGLFRNGQPPAAPELPDAKGMLLVPFGQTPPVYRVSVTAEFRLGGE